ncbi:MAG: ATP-binding protein [Candidatus Micrarchaeota archaeon]|nr:ATP-binding protein [Candidatus Micrarchaeota archaeon]MDE1847739.1 ATP-binding protein [Candidatus Micrarchaeota archaeon]MDE1863882.1 ATP-binding protein [Candidatus Micrarchaeota archaeon]
MTLVRIQNLMSNELAKRVFLTRPPEPPHEYLLNDPTNSIFIGITKIFSSPFTWSFANLTNPHLAVVGITGAGKSFFVKTFLIRASYIWNANAIIIDWAGEYKAWVKQSGGTVISLAKGDFLNIMDLTGMKPLDRAKQIITSFEILTDIGEYPEQRRLTMEAIEQSYVNLGFPLASVPDPIKEPPTLKNVISLLEEKLQDGTYEYPAELENAIYRLRQFAREGEDYFAKKSTLDLGKIASSGLVALDLSSLPDEKFRALAALFVLQSLKEKMRMEGWSASKGLRAIVVLDEAWKVASDERSDAVMIVREGRKYQFGLIVASQNPTDINEAIFSNVGTTVMLRIKFEKFMNYLQGSLNFSDFIRKEISKFGVGQAAIDMSFQTSVQFPEVFVIDRVVGEMPIDVFTLSVADILNQAELENTELQKEYYFERVDLRNRLIESNVGLEVIEGVLSKLETQNRFVDVRGFIGVLTQFRIERDNIILFMRGLGMQDALITRAFTYGG